MLLDFPPEPDKYRPLSPVAKALIQHLAAQLEAILDRKAEAVPLTQIAAITEEYKSTAFSDGDWQRGWSMTVPDHKVANPGIASGVANHILEAVDAAPQGLKDQFSLVQIWEQNCMALDKKRKKGKEYVQWLTVNPATQQVVHWFVTNATRQVHRTLQEGMLAAVDGKGGGMSYTDRAKKVSAVLRHWEAAAAHASAHVFKPYHAESLKAISKAAHEAFVHVKKLDRIIDQVIWDMRVLVMADELLAQAKEAHTVSRSLHRQVVELYEEPGPTAVLPGFSTSLSGEKIVPMFKGGERDATMLAMVQARFTLLVDKFIQDLHNKWQTDYVLSMSYTDGERYMPLVENGGDL